MAYVGRLGGALLAVTEGRYFLVGDLKEPVDFARCGFERPRERDIKAEPGIELRLTGAPHEALPPLLKYDVEGEALVAKLAAQFIIKRNSSVSDRLWRLVLDTSPLLQGGGREVSDARWLGATPDEVWDIVRDAVLRCS